MQTQQQRTQHAPWVGEAQAAPDDLLTVPQFSNKYPAWSPAAVRSMILNAEDRLNSRGETIHGNGLAQAGAIWRLGSRVYVSPSRFFWWIAHGQRRKAA